MGWLGLDDTDSLAGGCTTEAFHRLITNLPEGVVCGTPRLVRLWPFARRRTRGNAALSIEIHASDEAKLLAHLEAWWHTHLAPLSGQVEASTISQRPQVPTSPGMVWFTDAPDESYYWEAVRGDVSNSPRPQAKRAWGGHGCIGATAAVAWPAREATWEAIAWRMPGVLGPRQMDDAVLREVDGWPNIVFSRDPRRGHQLVAPRGPSPVLFGIRSRTMEDAQRACLHLLESTNTEPAIGWRVFKTNQASGDHLGADLRRVIKSKNVDPVRKHVVLASDSEPIKVFYEGGPVNALARWLEPGDEVLVRGLVHPDGTLHAEQLRLAHALPRQRQRPLCGECGVRMKSMGAGQGLRCPACKRRTADAWDDVVVAPPTWAWTEPDVDARRHLARPLAWSENNGNSGRLNQNDEKQW